MNMRLLRSFVMLSEDLNFTATAKRLYISQSTLSHQISELEKAVGTPLFYRDKRSVSLTKNGSLFLQAAKDILKRYDEVVEKLRLSENGFESRLRLGFYGSPFYSFIPGVVRTFRRQHPETAFTMESLQPPELTEGLITGRLDVILSANWVPEQNLINGTQSFVIGRDRIVAVLPKDHPFSNRTSICLSELRDEPFIMLKREKNPLYYDMILSLCEDAGFSPIVANTVNELREMYIFVEAGCGVALSMALQAESYADNISFMPLSDEPGTSLETIVIWKKNNQNPALPPFLDICRQAAFINYNAR